MEKTIKRGDFAPELPQHVQSLCELLSELHGLLDTVSNNNRRLRDLVEHLAGVEPRAKEPGCEHHSGVEPCAREPGRESIPANGVLFFFGSALKGLVERTEETDILLARLSDLLGSF